MDTPRGKFQRPVQWFYRDTVWWEELARTGGQSLENLSSPCLGEFVTGHRSSWVRRAAFEGGNCYIKTYDYATPGARWRGLGRNTLFAPSRARREAEALNWLQEHGFGGPRVLGVAEARGLLFLRRATLVTEAWPGEPTEALLSTLDEASRESLLGSIVELVRGLHAAGFRDRNLDLRNLLARRVADGFEVVKIDSPRWRVSAGGPGDSWARQDWDRLRRSCAELGMDIPTGPAR